MISRLSCNRDSTPLTAGMAAIQLFCFTDIQLHSAAEEIIFADFHILERQSDTANTGLVNIITSVHTIRSVALKCGRLKILTNM